MAGCHQITGVANGATFTTWNDSSRQRPQLYHPGGPGGADLSHQCQQRPAGRRLLGHQQSRHGQYQSHHDVVCHLCRHVQLEYRSAFRRGQCRRHHRRLSDSPISSYGWWAYNGTADCYTCSYGTAANAFQAALSICAMNYSGVWTTSDWSYNGQSVKLIGGSTAASFNSVGIASQTLAGHRLHRQRLLSQQHQNLRAPSCARPSSIPSTTSTVSVSVRQVRDSQSAPAQLLASGAPNQPVRGV